MNPGLVLPGVVGTICLLIALYALHLLPVNYAGLALMVLGIGFMIAEAFFPAYGSLGIGGPFSLLLGPVLPPFRRSSRLFLPPTPVAPRPPAHRARLVPALPQPS